MEPASPVTGIDFVCLPTRDHDRAVAFYGETLGLVRGKRWGDRPATEFRAGDLTLAVMDPRGFGGKEPQPNATPVALRVDDVDAARALLESRGVSFGAQFDSGVCHQALFSDPDGNPLTLHHRYAPPGDRVAVVRACYGAYESGDRDALEQHLADDFTFSAPPDVGLDRATYFERCWPNASNTAAYAFTRLFAAGGEVHVTYACTRTDGSRFCNTEIFGFDDHDKVCRVEVYFGWELD